MDRSDDEGRLRALARACGVTYRPPAACPPDNVIPFRRAIQDPRHGAIASARPRWVFPKGAFSDENLSWLGSAPAFTPAGPQIDPSTDIKTVLVPGVEPRDGSLDRLWRDWLIGRHAVTGRLYRVCMTGFDFRLGNAHFFDRDDTARVRLRPLLPIDWRSPHGSEHDVSPWFGGHANNLLWIDHPDGSGLTAFLVSLTPAGPAKGPETVARAIEYVRREYESAYPAAVALLT